MRCIVPSCNHDSRQRSKSPNITFHLLPTEPSKRAAWLKALGEVNWNATERSVGVCSCHFMPEDMYISRGRQRLRTEAVPVLKQSDHKVFDCLLKPCDVKVNRLQAVDSLLQGTETSKCRDVKACRICLAIDCKLYSTARYQSLDRAYENLTGLSIATEQHLPPYLCSECAQRLLSYAHFRTRSLRTRNLLGDIAKKHDCITLKILKLINRNEIKSNLSVTHNTPNCYDMEIEHIEQESQTDKPTDGEDLNDIKTEEDLIEYDHLIEDDLIDERIDVLGLVRDVNDEMKKASDSDNLVGDLGCEDIIDSVPCVDKSVDDPISDNSFVRQGGRDTKRKGMRRKAIVEKHSNTSNNRRGRKRKVIVDDSCTDDDFKIVKNKKSVKKRAGNDRKEKNAEKENCEETAEGDTDLRLLEEKHQKLSRRLRDSLDRGVFTVTTLTLAEQVAEVQARRRLPAYTTARYQCTVCYRGFQIQHCYEAHLVKHHEVSGAYPCVVCRVRTRSEHALRKHMTASHTRRYSCNLCPFVSKHKGAATQHQNFHAGIVYQCPHCPMSSNNCTTYQNHLRIKHASQFVCALCGYTFVNEKGLHMHKKIKHRIGDALVVEGPHCAACDVRFISAVAYERHLKLSANHCREDDPERISNDPQKMWADARRSRSLRLARRTAIRSRSPAGENPSGAVVCEQCGEQLPNRRAYAHHFRRAHPSANRTQFPPHDSYSMCELCGHVFRCNALLMCHMWQRHGVGEWRPRPPVPRRPRSSPPPHYECPICGKLFTVKYNFQRHVFNHTGQRPYKCDKCPKSFKSRAEKQSHVDHVHLKKPWPKRVRPRRKQAASSEISVQQRKQTTSKVVAGEERRVGKIDENGVMTDDNDGLWVNNEEDSVMFDQKWDVVKKGRSGLVFSDDVQDVWDTCDGASMLSDEENLRENNEAASVVSDERELGENNKGSSIFSDEEKGLDEESERASAFYDKERNVEENNDGMSTFSDQEQEFGENIEKGVSIFSEEQDVGDNNDGASVFSDEEQYLGEDNEGASIFSDEEQRLMEEDGSCVVEDVWEDQQDIWYEPHDSMS